MQGVTTQPEAFRAGYYDGCSSGHRAGGWSLMEFRKDTARYPTDPLYTQGWRDGYDVCKSIHFD